MPWLLLADERCFFVIKVCLGYTSARVLSPGPIKTVAGLSPKTYLDVLRLMVGPVAMLSLLLHEGLEGGLDHLQCPEWFNQTRIDGDVQSEAPGFTFP